eukprot:scaffold1534_cov267-Pinguiococcus_pyrenoidosus.AAC.16
MDAAWLTTTLHGKATSQTDLLQTAPQLLPRRLEILLHLAHATTHSFAGRSLPRKNTASDYKTTQSECVACRGTSRHVTSRQATISRCLCSGLLLGQEVLLQSESHAGLTEGGDRLPRESDRVRKGGARRDGRLHIAHLHDALRHPRGRLSEALAGQPQSLLCLFDGQRHAGVLPDAHETLERAVDHLIDAIQRVRVLGALPPRFRHGGRSLLQAVRNLTEASKRLAKGSRRLGSARGLQEVLRGAQAEGSRVHESAGGTQGRVQGRAEQLLLIRLGLDRVHQTVQLL